MDLIQNRGLKLSHARRYWPLDLSRMFLRICATLPDGVALTASGTGFRPSLRMWVWRAVAGSALLLGLPASQAHAQARLDARYEVTLAGIPIGRGTWIVDIADDQYSAVASGGSVGILNAVSSGKGNTGAQGRVVKGQLVPAGYIASITSNKKAEIIRFGLVGGNVKDFVIDPEPKPNAERVPLTEAHMHGVTDPMTASLIAVPGTGAPVSAEACAVTSAVFDGHMRYDLQLAYKRIAQVKAEKGYQGPAVVCAIYFTPVAGHIPDRFAIKYLTEERDMEVWLVPIAGTRVLVPFKVTIPTPLGTGVLQATQFQATPLSAMPPSRGAAPVGGKTQ
jgi:hypothetical protein